MKNEALYQYVQITGIKNIEPTLTILETGSMEDIKWDIQYDVKKWETFGGEVIAGDSDSFEFHLNESDGTPKYRVYLSKL
jgi:hypothetical protein